MPAALAAVQGSEGEFKLHNKSMEFCGNGTPGPYCDRSHLVPSVERASFQGTFPILGSPFLQSFSRDPGALAPEGPGHS